MGILESHPSVSSLGCQKPVSYIRESGRSMTILRRFSSRGLPMEDDACVDNNPRTIDKLMLCSAGLHSEKRESHNILSCSSAVPPTREAMYSLSYPRHHVNKPAGGRRAMIFVDFSNFTHTVSY